MDLSVIHHIAIIVSDYEKSKAFYVEKLGFPIVRETYRKERGDYKLDLKAGNCELEIFSGRDHPPRPNYPEALGLRHLAFWVPDVEAAARELWDMGIHVEDIRVDPVTNRKMTFFRDPDGLPLELHE